MPAPAGVSPRERLIALAAAALVQAVLALAFLNGLRVQLSRPAELIQQLIEVSLPKPPPPRVIEPRLVAHHAASSAPKARPKPLGGNPGPKPSPAPPSVSPVVAVHPSAAPSGGGSGSGPAVGAGAGGGAGTGAGEGGTDLVQIAGAITPSDYPPDLRERGIGGRVGIVFTVGPSGRVTRCTVTRSSGVPELDALTCRLIQQRFIYRPSTDRYSRPIADEVEGEHDWVAR